MAKSMHACSHILAYTSSLPWETSIQDVPVYVYIQQELGRVVHACLFALICPATI